MAIIAAVDIGTSRIKALIGRTGKWGVKIDSWRHIHYHHPALAASGFDPDNAREYETAQPQLIEALANLRAELPRNTQWRIGFNSLHAKLHPMRIQASNCKRLRIAAEVYRDKLSDHGWRVDYRTLWFDRRLRQGEVMLWACREKAFEDLLITLEQAALKPSVIEFDALALASAFERVESAEQKRMLLDFGFAKTIMLFMRGDTLLHCRVIPRGLASVCERVGQRLNLKLGEVETRITEPQSEWAKWTEMGVNELFEPFLLHVQRDLADIDEQPAEIYVSGGLANHKAFFHLLENRMNARVRRFDPLPADESVPWELHGAFNTAYGLLTR